MSENCDSLVRNQPLMTGSGSALFGIFQTAAEARAAASKFPPGTAISGSFRLAAAVSQGCGGVL